MGRARRAKERLPCALCGSAGYAPCISRTTGRDMKHFHQPRKLKGRDDHLNAQVRHIEREEATEFEMFSWIALGLDPAKYPLKVDPALWASLYQRYPGINPADQYNAPW